MGAVFQSSVKNRVSEYSIPDGESKPVLILTGLL